MRGHERHALNKAVNLPPFPGGSSAKKKPKKKPSGPTQQQDNTRSIASLKLAFGSITTLNLLLEMGGNSVLQIRCASKALEDTATHDGFWKDKFRRDFSKRHMTFFESEDSKEEQSEDDSLNRLDLRRSTHVVSSFAYMCAVPCMPPSPPIRTPQ